MKKNWLASAVAVAAIAVGGAASAQGYNLGYDHNTGTTPDEAIPYSSAVIQHRNGQRVLVQPNSSVPYHAGYDAWGRPLYRDSNGGLSAIAGLLGGQAYPDRRWDRDGDGVPNNRDRRPNDRRYY